MTTTALILGGGSTLWADFAAYDGGWDMAVACNDAGAEWPHTLDAWATLHPEKMGAWSAKRAANGFTPSVTGHYAHRQPDLKHCGGVHFNISEILFPGQKKTGSSGLYAAKVAMIDLGADRLVFCGVPMTITPHFFDSQDWKSAEGFRRQWLSVPSVYRARMRSMSGWSRALLGQPEWNTQLQPTP